ncbi:outer membrane protein assembly factor BamB family protein [Methanococcoides sp.]|jgi:outer membrane protein assembly factor BamB|uniref:outer membrane protein assembly factor BamB family protein n=1 Tax=Methanococcoides sp. TaxID=1966350 RepID=UPI00272DD088|nr:PQQ-binding-like beta-propeller repeat protein [Methanococcoides sp.]
MNIKSLGLALATMLVLSLLATGASASDWPTFQKNNYNNGVTSEDIPDDFTPSPSDTWTFTGASGGWLGWESAPIIGDGITYNVYYNGDIYAIGLTNGTQVWCNDELGGSGNFELSVPAYDDAQKRLYVGLSSGNASTSTGIHALHSGNGTAIWSNTSSTEFPSSHQLNTPIKYDSGQDAIYFGSTHMSGTYTTDDGYFYCVDADTGVVNWKYDNDCGFYFTSPAIIGNYVVVGDDDGTVRVFDLDDGDVVDSIETSSIQAGAGSIRSGIVYDDGTIYYTTTEGYLIAIGFNSATGDLDGNDTDSETTGARTTTTPAVTSDYVYVGTDGSAVKAYERSTLTCLDTCNTNGPVKASPVVTTYPSGEERVYVTTNTASGRLYACTFDTTDEEFSGSPYWGPTGSSYTLQGIAFADSWLVYGNDNKKIFGLTE